MTQEAANPDGRSTSAKPAFFIALGVVVFAVVFPALHVAGGAILRRQKDAILAEKIAAGRLLAAQLSASAVLPLLGDDGITLGNLTRKIPATGSILFLAVADAGNVVRSHTDPARVGEPLRLPPDREAFDLSGPLVIRDKIVGSAHVVLSREALEREAADAADRMRRLLTLSGIAVAAGIAILSALFARLGAVFRRPAARHGGESPGDGPAFRVMAVRDLPAETPLRDKGPRSFRPQLRVAPAAGSADGEGTGEKTGPPRVARNQATVLACHVRGVKAYADSRRPEELVAGLDAYFDIVDEIIAAHGGRAGSISGDTVVVVFGGAEFPPDHTSRAVRAALELQAAFRDAAYGKHPLLGQVAIGISSGVILSCEAGASRRTEPIMIGESFKAANGLAMLAGPGEIIVGREVCEHLGDAVSVDPLPPREFLDRTGSWESFRLQDDLRKRA